MSACAGGDGCDPRPGVPFFCVSERQSLLLPFKPHVGMWPGCCCSPPKPRAYRPPHVPRHDMPCRAVSPVLCSLSRLAVLRLRGNQLRALPASVGQLCQLEVLDVGDNLVEGLPHELGDLPALRELRVSQRRGCVV